MEEYCSTVEKLLEATAAMSLAVENKKPMTPVVPAPPLATTTNVVKMANKQPTFSESSLEDRRNKPPPDRRKSYSQGQNSSLDCKPANTIPSQQQGNDITAQPKPSQDVNKVSSTQMSISKSVDRRYSIASTHIAIANHISSSSQGTNSSKCL